jgi:hypothetical protein
MTLKCVWKITGVIKLITNTCDKYSRPYWQLTLEVDEGLITLFVHNESLIPTIGTLQIGDIVEGSGEILPKKGEAHKPQFLNPSEIRVLTKV